MSRHSYRSIVLVLMVMIAACGLGPSTSISEYTAHLTFYGQPPPGLRYICVDLVPSSRNYPQEYYLQKWADESLDSVLTAYESSGSDTLSLTHFWEITPGRYHLSAWMGGLADTSNENSWDIVMLKNTWPVDIEGDRVIDAYLFEGDWPDFVEENRYNH